MADYTAALASLLPVGPAWPREADTRLMQLTRAMAREFQRVDDAARLLEEEADPNTALLALPDFERVYGLPDECTGGGDTFEQRRFRLLQKMTMPGGQSAAFFKLLAETRGYDIELTSFSPMTCESPCDQPVYGSEWAYALLITAPATQVNEMTCQSACDEPLRSWGESDLECTMRRHQHAHTIFHFAYEDAA